MELLAVPAAVLGVDAEHDQAGRQRDDQRVEIEHGDQEPVDESDHDGDHEHVDDRLGQAVVGALRHADEHVGQSEMVAPIDRSMPPIMITSI